MVEHFLDGKVTLHAGDCIAALAELGECSIDSCVTDPPYHLTSIVKRFGADNAAPAKFGADGRYARATSGFMGKQWDGGDISARPETWAAVYRVLKPGGYLLAFGGTRTYHRMACAIEDAGFEVRDMVSWLYGSGFPKSHDVSKGIDRAAGAAREVVGVNAAAIRNKQRDTTWTGDVWGDNGATITAPATAEAREWAGWGTALKPALEPICMARKPLIGTVAANVLEHGTGAINIDGCRVDGVVTSNPLVRNARGFESDGLVQGETGKGVVSTGRWPANVIHDGSEEVTAAFPESSSGTLTAEHRRNGGYSNNRKNEIFGKGSERGCEPDASTYAADSGSAARFYYSAKADADDRLGSRHPTVKPVDLMQYLVRLVTPRGGLVIDPFAGTGTTGEAAWREGMRAVLIEREQDYQADIRRRMALVLAGPDERSRESIKAKGAPVDYGPLFAVPYDPVADFEGSIDDCYAAIRERKANGGAGWPE